MASTDRRAEELVADVMRRSAVASVEDASRFVRTTLAVLGERLTSDEAAAIADAVGPALGRFVTESGYDGDFDAPELYERVRRREDVAIGFAREHVHIVLRTIAERLDDGARRRLIRALPVELGVLLEPSSRDVELPPYAEVSHAPKVSSLAAGRPGSTHPVSEAAPPAGHAHSVAKNPDPHADTKLSSARGTTQERLGDTLASGRPPAPARPVAEAHDEAAREREGGVS